MKRLAHRWRLILVVVVVILAIALNRRILPLFGQWLDVSGPPQKADAVVLLNGGFDSRPFVAAALVHGHWAPTILVNSVAPHDNQIRGEIPDGFQINSLVFRYGDVPDDRVILLDSAAQTTFDEAKGVADYVETHPVQRLLIVTEWPHTRRSRWIFERVLAGRPVQIVMIGAPAEGFEHGNWWQCEAGFLFVVSEYFKLFFYGLRYGWLGAELVALVVVAVLLRTWFLRRRKLAARGVAAAGQR